MRVTKRGLIECLAESIGDFDLANEIIEEAFANLEGGPGSGRKEKQRGQAISRATSRGAAIGGAAASAFDASPLGYALGIGGGAKLSGNRAARKFDNVDSGKSQAFVKRGVGAGQQKNKYKSAKHGIGKKFLKMRGYQDTNKDDYIYNKGPRTIGSEDGPAGRLEGGPGSGRKKGSKEASGLTKLARKVKNRAGVNSRKIGRKIRKIAK
jgi:hypothetical protein